MVPLIMAYVGGGPALSRQRSLVLSLTFATGLAITYMLLGIAATLIGGIVGPSPVWYYIVAAVCLLIGLEMLGIVHIAWPSWWNDLPTRITLKGVPGALGLGLTFGLVASQCATPILAAIITYVLSSQATLFYGATLLFVYAMGRGVPIVLAGTFTGMVSQRRALQRWSVLIERISGTIMLGVGLYFIWIA
ncbi:MAG: cytochrome c biogenesis protein CcdA [Anaerolineae bacterium]